MKPYKGQIAVIITFVIAVIFLFVAVFINLSKVSQVKTATSQATDKAALGLASQLGSMSHYYKEKVFNGKPKEPICTSDLGQIVDIPALYLASFILSPKSFLSDAGALFSNTMLGAISERITKDMSNYNGWREKVLLEVLLSIQADDVWFKSKAKGTGIFLDASGNEYDLSLIPGMLNQPKVDRFLAWYYTKRYPLVSEEGLRRAINNFVNKLKDVVVTEKWDPKKWMITEFSLKAVMDTGQITCTSPACPPWVIDSKSNSIRVAKFDESNNASGFLIDKFAGLLDRLEGRGYEVSFFKKSIWKEPWAKVFGGMGTELKNVIEDLNTSLKQAVDLLNLPLSVRAQQVTEWFPKFYDLNIHDREKDGKSIVDSLDPTNDGRDIYERLQRCKDKLNAWLNEVSSKIGGQTSINEKIKEGIRDNHGSYCLQGYPDYKESCYTRARCGCPLPFNGCAGDICENPAPARWWGSYGTCTGADDHSAHPVCINGDLYEAAPKYLDSNWCKKLRPSPGCVSRKRTCPEMNCNAPGTKTTIDNSYYFQGQMSWENTSGPTEVGQAAAVLSKIIFTITQVQDAIKALADIYAAFLDKDSPLRNEITYAWKDEKFGLSHLAYVAIPDYPKDLPYITEERKWFEFKKCQSLKAYEGDFQITASRYDQDQPAAAGWQLRRRKQPANPEFNAGILSLIVGDIQNTTQVAPPREYSLTAILSNYAITSTTTAHYGPEKSPEKSDIRITGTKNN